MMKKKYILAFVPVLILFFSCAGAKGGVRYGSMPAWVNDVYSVYDSARYVAAYGYGNSREAAERNALASLVSFFGQTVQIERNAASFYRQAVTDGVISGWIDTAEMRTNVNSSSSMDNLMGVEIGEVWYDSTDTYYAVAVMEKARAIRVYSELIQANLSIINNLTAVSPDEYYSLDSVIRYRFAAVVAEVNASYRNIILLLGGSVPDGNNLNASSAALLSSSDYYLSEAQKIIKEIPVSITINNAASSARLFGAFAKCFSDWGFTVTDNSQHTRYVLNADVSLTPVRLPDNANFFSRIELSANLTDTNLNLVLLPLNFSSREGQTSAAEAETRAIAAAERYINEQYSALLTEYLSRLLPKK